MEKTKENDMETGGIQGFKELKLRYYSKETLIFAICPYYGNLPQAP